MSGEHTALLTCPTCRVTARVVLTGPSSCCPYCGHGYDDEGAITFWRPQHQAVHLPHIPESRAIPGRFGTVTISRLGGVHVTRLGALMLRPPSPTLPPISQVHKLYK